MKDTLRSSPVCWAVFFVMFGGCSIWGLYSYISGITCYIEFIPHDFPNYTIIGRIPSTAARCGHAGAKVNAAHLLVLISLSKLATLGPDSGLVLICRVLCESLLLVFVSAVAPLVLFVGVGACYAGRRRSLMRKRFQIPGSSAGDCCT